jgi:HEAT repeat protein
MATFVIIVTASLCAVLSLGKRNNERRYDGQSASQWLAAISDTSARVRMTAAVALDYLCPAAGPVRERIVRAELHLLGDPDADVRNEATAALAGMATESPGVVLATIAVLNHSPRAEARVQAARALGAAGAAAEPAIWALVRAASASDALLRVAAVVALGDIGASRNTAVPEVLIRAATDEDDNVRAVAIEAMAGIQMERARLLPVAIRALRDRSADVRERAAYVLDRSSDTSPPTRAALAVAATDEDSAVRRIAAAALARHRP